MNFIECELQEIKKLCEHLIVGSKLVTCVQTMVRVEIKRTPFKVITACIQFPVEYPDCALLLELKSKTISDRLLSKLSDVCEQEIKKLLGKPQVLKVLHFISNFIEENPLCCCYDEINNIKKLLTLTCDELKLKQKTSSLSLKIVNDNYFLKSKILVPDTYPEKFIIVENLDTNFPPLFQRFITAQCKELGRRCIEPPLRKKKPNEPPFKIAPSLEKVVSFLIDCVKRLPQENCQLCGTLCFPANPNDIITDESAAKHVERVYCGHLFHNECLITYMKKPPFGNKKCLTCGKKIYHDKWSLTDKLAEDRWAHEQARERELAEVADFFQ